MTGNPEFSLISPTFRRPAEVEEFLESLTHLRDKDFEVILADGSPDDEVRPVAERYRDRLPLTFLHEKYLAVSPARNKAAEAARGGWLVFLDSDCLIPPDYLHHVREGLKQCHGEVFGGPDAAHPSFTLLQKAISHSMTSLLTTGGIRGRRTRTAAYRPRSFNMGVKRAAFFSVGGFSTLLCGEDVDLSIRLEKAGYKICFIEQAFVYHKRRTTWRSFFRQVYRFGAARVLLARRHAGELRLTHLFPALFVLGFVLMGILSVVWPPGAALMACLYGCYLMAIGVEASVKNNHIALFLPAIGAAFIQLLGYGLGFLRNWWEVYIRRRPEGIPL